MKKPKLQVWRPINKILKGRIYNHNITLDNNGLKISLNDEIGASMEIVYERSSQIIGDCVWSYRYTNEILKSGFLVDLMQEAHSKANINSEYEVWFYKMINSDFVDSVKQTGFADDSVHLEHHLFPVSDGVLEVISDYEPKIIYNQFKS